jgi:outer membrane receptor protein involved in Fe transport
MSVNSGRLYARLLGGAAVLALSAGIAQAEPANFNIAPQPLALAVGAFSEQSGRPVLLKPELADKLATKGVSGSLEPELALAEMLSGTGLTYRKTGDTFLIVGADAPQSGSAAGDGADGTVQALIVTAQKREENVQDVPIAISAFTEKTLQEQKIEGGFDLLKAIPNVTFSKNNFTSYNFSIRGIGTKAVSATTDPGVAVSFNNIALLQNRLFEQEYFDVERVEVLRGPQGTLYGRNATAGVINVISAKPNLHEFDGWVKGEVGNYHTKRLSAMVNVPLITDKLGIRLAGAMTDRQGYDFNEGTGHAINGRDLWSGRVTIAFNPTERMRTNVVWERFNEDDNRSRTGKQVCHHDSGPEAIGGTSLAEPLDQVPGGDLIDFNPVRRAVFSQGCLPGSLYDDGAFGTPNGLALPFVRGLSQVDNFATGVNPINFRIDPYSVRIDDAATCSPDPAPCYRPGVQSHDLRVVNSIKDPHYVAKADVIELNLEFDLTDALTVYSQSVYNKDTTYSNQDYNRFNTLPIFRDSTELLTDSSSFNDPYADITRGGIFCDPQLGCSDKMVGFDVATAKGQQWGQEIRLQSNFDGPINFSAGANYTKFKTLVDYYVFYNLLSAIALLPPFNFAYAAGENPYTFCYPASNLTGLPVDTLCPYVDPNPLESINGEGHNYFRSKNPYKLSSTAAFGEVYWNATDVLKVTAGLRYTDDRKTFIPVPSQILLADGAIAGGTVGRGYPEGDPIKQHWGEWTGRLGVDWKPTLSFTDQSMVYAFYSRGYKGGGANPPAPGFGPQSLFSYSSFLEPYLHNAFIARGVEQYWPKAQELFNGPILHLTGVEYERTFKPEFVNAFEVGSKNTLMGGALVANADAFFYDYKDYQVSQIRDRTAVNENFDAKVWGLEFQTTFAPSRDLQVIANIGYLDTRIADGETSIDIMDRTASNPDFVVVKSWIQLPSNCIVPIHIAEYWAQHNVHAAGADAMCGGKATILDFFTFPNTVSSGSYPIDVNTGTLYDPNYYNGQNGTLNIHGGAGIAKELGGNELPNAPHWTMNIGAQYGHDILDGSWRATVRADAYWQSQSWARVYNDNPYDKLHGWYNVNLSVWFERPDDDLKIELYAKNILDKTPITDAFLNSDDTALTTNVFVLDPRLIGLSIHKGF